jgi:uncharacterized protein (DUF58 family)
LLGFAALRNQDRLGLLLVSDRVEHAVPPARGRRQVLRVLRDVLEHRSTTGRTDLSAAARHVMRTVKRRSVVFVLSDFETALDPKPWRVLARRHDVTTFLLRDPRDEVLPSAGWIEFEDLETGERRLARTSSRAFRAAYHHAARERRRDMEKMLRSTRCGVVELATDQSYLPVLLHYFSQRARGRR